MPESPEAFWERTHDALRMPPLDDWDSWPFVGELAPKELDRPVAVEKQRHGLGGVDCSACARGIEGALWHDDRWMFRPLSEPTGLPFIGLLETRAHVDFPDLDEQHAADLGPLLLRVEHAVAAIPGVGNVHIGRWGEGSEHCHIWFLARPARMEQLRSSFAEIWDGVLPPTPPEIWDANLEIVGEALRG